MLTLINKVSAKGDLANQVVLDPRRKLAGTVTYASARSRCTVSRQTAA